MRWIDKIIRLERSFDLDLFEQLVVELAAMYDQQQYVIEQPFGSWRSTREVERRLDRFSLCIHEMPQEVLERGLRFFSGAEEQGDLYSFIRVLCMQSDEGLLTSCLVEMNLEDPGIRKVVCTALRHGLSDDRRQVLKKWMSIDPDRFSDLVYEVIGWRRWPIATLGTVRGDLTPMMAWALGRVGDRSHDPLLRRALVGADALLMNTTAIALLRMGDESFLDDYLNPNIHETKPWLAMGLVRQNRRVEKYLQDLADSASCADCILALGLSGRAAWVDVLLERLQDDKLTQSVALAVELITGVGVYEEDHAFEKLDEDALFDEERQDLDPASDVGPQIQSGQSLMTVCKDPLIWKEELKPIQSGFKPSAKYRHGQPHSLNAVVSALQSDRSSKSARELVQEELPIKYKLHTRFEHDMWVDEQELILAEIVCTLKKTKWFGRSTR